MVTCSPDGRIKVVSFVTTWLVRPASAPMFCRAMTGAGGSTNHEAWLAVTPLRNAAGLTTAGPYVTREPGVPTPGMRVVPTPGMVLAANPEKGSWSSVQYGDAGFLSRNRPVTRSPAAAGPDRVAAFSTEPGVTCSRLATATGSATGSGWPGCGGPGHVPAVSVVWALIPASAATWICQSTGGGSPRTGLGSARTARGGESVIGRRPQRASHLVTDPRPCLAQRGTDLARVGGRLPGAAHHAAEPDHPALRRGEDALRSGRDHRGGERPEPRRPARWRAGP